MPENCNINKFLLIDPINTACRHYTILLVDENSILCKLSRNWDTDTWSSHHSLFIDSTKKNMDFHIPEIIVHFDLINIKDA